MKGNGREYDHEVVQDGDARENHCHVVGLQQTTQVRAHVAHAVGVQLVEALQHHDRLTEHGGPA